MVQFVGGAREFLSSPKHADWLWAHLASHSIHTGGHSSGVKKLECDANHSSPPSTKLKNEQTNTSTSPYTFTACTQITLHLPSRPVICSILYFSATI